MSIDHIANAVADGHAQHGIRPAGFAYLGDGSGLVVVDLANRIVNCYQITPTGTRSVFQAYLWSKANIPLADIDPGVIREVELGYPYNNAPLHVLGESTAGIASNGGLSSMERKIYETQSPQATQIQD